MKIMNQIQVDNIIWIIKINLNNNIFQFYINFLIQVQIILKLKIIELKKNDLKNE